MPAKLTASAARQNFSDVVNRAAYGGERIIVHRGKKPVAAVVPIEDLELLEQQFRGQRLRRISDCNPQRGRCVTQLSFRRQRYESFKHSTDEYGGGLL